VWWAACKCNDGGERVHGATFGEPPRVCRRLLFFRLHPWLRRIFADDGYAGDKLRDALSALGRWTVQIIKRSDTAQGFAALPRRWVVEPSFAWLGRCRRLAKDFEATIESATAWTLIAHLRRLTRVLARP
jgi:transposase